MLSEVMNEANNHFIHKGYYGQYVISGSTISPLPSEVVSGVHVLVIGSLMNDGVFVYPFTDAELSNETFEGWLVVLAVPVAFRSLVSKIATWCEEHPDTKPYASEAFDGYSYSVATRPDGSPVTWADVFALEINKWRKPHSDIVRFVNGKLRTPYTE